MPQAPNAAPPRRVAELAAGERVEDQIFRIQQKDLRTTSNGGLYIHAVLADNTGQLLARMWNATQEIYDTIPEGGLLRLRGRVESYKGARQFIIDGVRLVEPGSVNPADFLPSTRQNIPAMWEELLTILRTVQNRDLLALLAKFIGDEAFVRDLQIAPAAVQMHHAYRGGLLEHTLNLLRLANAVCPLYPAISRDLVIVGVFLHDAGKTREFRYATNFEYTNEGQLLGHIVQCVQWIEQRCAQIGQETGKPFPPDVLMTLEHIVLAHHGKYEFGSPRLPATAEAIMVHYLDNLDAKVNMVFEAIAADTDASSDWTGYVKALETRVFKPDVLGTRPARAERDDGAKPKR